jgi:hypothetical protein
MDGVTVFSHRTIIMICMKKSAFGFHVTNGRTVVVNPSCENMTVYSTVPVYILCTRRHGHADEQRLWTQRILPWLHGVGPAQDRALRSRLG